MLVGMFLTLVVIACCWVWIFKPIIIALMAASKDVLKPVKSAVLVSLSVGNKLIKPSTKKIAEPEGVVSDDVALLDVASSPNSEIALWVKSYPVKKLGYVLFRGYISHLERCLVVEGNPMIQKQHGRRIQLPNLNGHYFIDDQKVVQSTIDETVGMFESFFSKNSSKPSSPKTLNIKEPALVQAPVVVQAPAIEKSLSSAVPAVTKEKPLEAYKGYLIGYGKAMRHMSSSKDGAAGNDNGKEIEQFRVVIRSVDGVDESIWGSDLFRAIRDANVKVEDMVEVIKTGKRQFGTVWKNLYVINKIA